MTEEFTECFSKAVSTSLKKVGAMAPLTTYIIYRCPCQRTKIFDMFVHTNVQKPICISFVCINKKIDLFPDHTCQVWQFTYNFTQKCPYSGQKMSGILDTRIPPFCNSGRMMRRRSKNKTGGGRRG